jgi:hypothetical protein
VVKECDSGRRAFVRAATSHGSTVTKPVTRSQQQLVIATTAASVRTTMEHLMVFLTRFREKSWKVQINNRDTG